MKTVYMIIGHKCWFALIYHLWVSLKNLQDQVWLAIWSIGHLYCTWVSDPEDGLHHPLLCFLAFTFTLDSLSITLWFLLFAWKRTKWLRKVQHRLLVTDREGLIFMYCVVLYFFLCKQTVSLDDDDDYVTRFFPMTFSCSGLKMAHRHALSPTLGKHFLCVFLLNNYLIMVQCGRPVSVSH